VQDSPTSRAGGRSGTTATFTWARRCTSRRPVTGIIDFEREPLRPLEERRRKHAAPRDIAGMLRSIDYAAGSMLGVPNSLRDWKADTARAFVEGYRAAAGSASFLPESETAFGEVVAVFELEKAAYEIVYEGNNRPDWLVIPKRGLLNAAARLGRTAEDRSGDISKCTERSVA
jgi:predicted trehalose synthase